MGLFSYEEKTCSECCQLDISKMDRNGMYYCEKKREYVSACARECNYYTKAYRRSDEEAKNLREAANNSGSGCFITTIVVNTLGYADNVSYLQTLRYFRDNVLQKNEKFKSILATYDVVGPLISKNIENDKNKHQICLNLFNLCIKDVCRLIKLNKEDEAINLYTTMTELLIKGFNINKSYDEQYLNNMDISKSGHGKVVVLK